ncbi:MAG TPA: tRNA (guanosine(46)-N7)-methyltransferase TrmB, partial [Burkholderiales bacterium]|nr:tRNA (guanosine(46)-N7)-methyltransferase TrmB [Burkholderiales bacterium]
MQEHRRQIRSFVLRQGRVSKAQRRAHADLLPVYGVPFSPASLDLVRVFGRAAPKILEIGFGMGETTADIAQQHPQNDYLGIEVHTPGVGSLLKRIADLRLENVRVIQHDAVEVLQHMIPHAALDGVHVFFPDPWPKKRHHKRRLIQPPFVALLASRMKPGARVHACTDWEEYARQMLDVF